MRFSPLACGRQPANMSFHTMFLLSALVATSFAFAPASGIPAHVVPASSPSLTASAATAAAESETKTKVANAVLLDDALRSDADASQQILNDIVSMRQNNQQMEAEKYLDELLITIDEKAPRWAAIPLMTRFSKRARMASLSRALKLSTPPADDEEGEKDAESEGRRRRRALAVLLRTLNKESEEQPNTGIFARPAIRTIEKAAVRGARESATLADMDNRVPEGLETPKYEVVVRKKGYEIRSYEPYSLATVAMNKGIKANDESRSKTDQKVSQPTLSGASSFGALAGYLFGKNSEETAMKMTSPVFTSNAGEKEGEMSFVMPSTYWREDGVKSAPQPLDGSGVKLQRSEGGTRAVVMFGGFASKSDVAKRKEQLLQSIELDKEYDVKEGSTVSLAQYNDPFTPGWKRRNEVSIDVLSVSK